MLSRRQKITLGEMRASGVRGLLAYCSDYHRSFFQFPLVQKSPERCRSFQFHQTIPLYQLSVLILYASSARYGCLAGPICGARTGLATP
jgi:hypothetical protein